MSDPGDGTPWPSLFDTLVNTPSPRPQAVSGGASASPHDNDTPGNTYDGAVGSSSGGGAHSLRSPAAPRSTSAATVWPRIRLGSPEPTSDHARAWDAAPTAEAAATVAELRLSTRPRRIFTVVCCALYLVAVVFLIVAQTGSTRTRPPSTSIYFFRMDLTELFSNMTTTTAANSTTATTSNPALASTIAQSIGLRDFYQAGLWGFCEGVRDNAGFAVTACSPPRAFYWFDPVSILRDELLLRSTIALPVRVTTVLAVLRVVSQVMFGVFLVGLVLSALLVVLSPLALLSRWWSLPVSLLAAAAALALFTGSAIATALALAYRLVGSAISQLNIGVTVGAAMFALVWLATGLALAAFILHSILGCCSTSVRDVTSGLRPFVRLSAVKTEATSPSRPEKTASSGLRRKLPFLSPLAMHPVKVPMAVLRPSGDLRRQSRAGSRIDSRDVMDQND